MQHFTPGISSTASRCGAYLLTFLCFLFLGISTQLSAQACTAAGGTFTLTNGDNSIAICTDDGVDDNLTTILTGNTGPTNYVVTTPYGLIVSTQASGTFNFEGTGSGPYFLYNVSVGADFTGSLAVGNNVCTLTPDDGCFSLSTSITIIRLTGEDCNGLDCNVEGGNLSLADGGGSIEICAGDGNSDAFDVLISGNSGDNMAWLITDTDGNILGLPAAPPFDLEGAGPGICLVWNISFQDDLIGLEVGANANDLDGCFDLSSPIQVIRNGVNGGSIAFADGSTDDIDVCINNGEADSIMVTQTDPDNVEGSNFTFVITDTEGNILGLPAAPPFDLSGAGTGTCLIWYLAFEDGLENAAVGNNAADLVGCFDLSNPIAVNRTETNGGTIAFDDDSDEINVCINNGEADSIMVTQTDPDNVEGSNFTFVITDTEGNILGLPAAPPFDLSGAGTGTCLIWYLAFEDGLENAAVGNNAADLVGCFDLSNPIAVNRTETNGGTIAFDDDSDEINVCINNGEADSIMVTQTDPDNVEGSNFTFVITDTEGNILGLPAAPPFDLSGAGTGTCLIWYLAFEDGLENAAVGNNAADLVGCFDLSNPIAVNRTETDGGTIAFDDGSDEITVCIDFGEADSINVNQVDLENVMGSNFTFVITDTLGNILGLPAAPPFDLSGAGEGTCLIWYLAFEDGLEGAAVGNNAADLTGCFDLSNPVAVVREICDECPNNAGTVAFIDDEGNTSSSIDLCVDDPEASTTFVDQIDPGALIGSNGSFVITDSEGTILAFFDEGTQLDALGEEPGTFLVWYISFEDDLVGFEIEANANDLEGCFALSEPITINAIVCDDECPNEAGEIAFSVDDSTGVAITELDLCLDEPGVDMVVFEILNEGDIVGANYAIVITDLDGNIISLLNEPPLDFTEFEEGSYLIWTIAFEDDLTGAEPGANAGDLGGCFDLSNPLTLNLESCEVLCENEAGEIAFFIDSTSVITEITLCSDEEGISQIPVLQVDGSVVNGTSFAIVITDLDLNILALEGEIPLDFSSYETGTYLIWTIVFEDDLTGAEPGANAADLGGCFDLSNPLTLNIIDCTECEPVASNILFDNGTDVASVCLNDSTLTTVDYVLTDDPVMTNGDLATLIIDDVTGVILDITEEIGTYDFSGYEPGTYLLFFIATDGVTFGLEIGANAADVSGCFDASNGLLVFAQNCGSLGTGDVVINEVTAGGQVELLNQSSEAVNLSSIYLATQLGHHRLDMLVAACGNLVLAPGEVLLLDAIPGLNVNDDEIALFTASDFTATTMLDYVQWGSNAHSYTNEAVAAGLWETDATLGAPTTEASLQLIDVEGNLEWMAATPTPCAVNGSPVTVFDLASGAKLTVFPNPVDDQVNISFGGTALGQSSLEVYDQTGRLVMSRQFDLGNQTVNLPTANLAAGTYYLRVNNGKTLITDRFVKLR